MDIQFGIVVLIVLVAALFAVRAIYRRAHSFAKSSGCEAGCGCGGKSKKLSSKPV